MSRKQKENELEKSVEQRWYAKMKNRLLKK